MTSKMDLNLLVVFDAVMSERNLREAGERLNRSQPAMSQAVARLRDITGDRLFDRTPTGVAPTPRAEVLWAEVRDPLAQLRRTFESTAFNPADMTGEIVFGLSDDIRILDWPRLARTITDQAPNVTLRILSTDHTTIWDHLRKGKVDLGLTVAGQPPAGCGARILRQDDFVLLHRKDRNAPKSAEEYGDCPQLALVFGEEQPAYADEALEASGQSRQVVVRASCFDALAPLVDQLNTVVALPRAIATHFAHQYDLTVSPLPVSFPPAIHKLCWNQRTRNDPQSQWLRDLVTEGLRQNAS